MISNYRLRVDESRTASGVATVIHVDPAMRASAAMMEAAMKDGVVHGLLTMLR